MLNGKNKLEGISLAFAYLVDVPLNTWWIDTEAYMLQFIIGVQKETGLPIQEEADIINGNGESKS